MAHDTKLYKVSEIANETGMSQKTIRKLCNKRGQRFATQLCPNGAFWIDKERFMTYLERRREA